MPPQRSYNWRNSLAWLRWIVNMAVRWLVALLVALTIHAYLLLFMWLVWRRQRRRAG